MTQVKMSYYITTFYWQNNPVITDNNWAFLWFTISKLYIIFYMYKIFFNIIASWIQQCLPSFRNRNVFSLNLHYLKNSSFFFTLLRGLCVKFSEQSLFNKIAHSCAVFADATTKGSGWYKLHTRPLYEWAQV